METGTLKELGVKSGDVVEWIEYGDQHTIQKVELITEGALKGQMRVDISNYGYGIFDQEQFRIISRASDKPRTWGEMTPEEKGALLLAAHEGKVIEAKTTGEKWYPASKPLWLDEFTYRIAPPEPKRETVTLYGGGKREMVWCMERRGVDLDTHYITFDMIDGKPDLASIKMEEL